MRWWRSDELCEVEQIIFDALESKSSLLDVGAGDLSFKKKLQIAGYQGKYETVDTSIEYSYDYSSLSEIDQRFEAILCLDVLEHLDLNGGLKMLDDLSSLLAAGGLLVIQTPNARCIRHPLSTDMTHLHCYNVSDLWAYLTACDLDVRAYRVVFAPQRRSPFGFLRYLVSAFVITRLLGCDYADNILLLAQKRNR